MTSTFKDVPSAALDSNGQSGFVASGRKPGNLKPCERCRSRHLKCVYDSDKCRRCERFRVECLQITQKIRFRTVNISKLRGEHKKTDSNGSKTGHVSLNFTEQAEKAEEDESRETKEMPSSDNISDGIHEFNIQGLSELERQEPSSNFGGTADVFFQFDTSTNVSQRPDRVDEDETNPPNIARPTTTIVRHKRLGSNSSTGFAQRHRRLLGVLSPDNRSVGPSFSPSQRPATRNTPAGLLDQLVKYPVKGCNKTSVDYLETVLLRYFHEELAPWLDSCDPDCYSTFMISHRAREPGPLRSALLTVSARNLTRNTRFRNAAGTIEWAGRQLPELREEFATTYQNDCIRDLLRLSMDPKNLHDETLLAAVIALRTDEDLSSSILEEEQDRQLFLRIASVFIEAQIPPSISVPHRSPKVSTPFDDCAGSQGDVSFQSCPRVNAGVTSPSDRIDIDLGASGMRRACFWTAFRQELHASLLRQQPVSFPLARCEAFRRLSPATDTVWANRMVTFCADVLEFCYGSSCSDTKVAPACTNRERWMELRAHERNLCALLPASFEPSFCSESDATQGVYFPEIWYLGPCHASGTTYVELARMLLEAFNPTRLKPGHGFLAATNTFVASTKRILFRLCGIALSNHRFCPPVLINACLGISMFGQYFEDPAEQEALLGVLALMSSRHAYPTHRIVKSLRRAWNTDDVYSDQPT